MKRFLEPIAQLPVAQPFRAAKPKLAGLKACATEGRRHWRRGGCKANHGEWCSSVAATIIPTRSSRWIAATS